MSALKRFKFPSMTSTKPSEKAPEAPLIVRFYDAEIQAKDSHGRTQEQMLAWSDDMLEDCHNYIQMLFPVPEGSAFNWEAPIINREVMETFRARSDLRDRMRMSFERMLNFYGFKVELETEEEGKSTQTTKIEDKPEEPTQGSMNDPTQTETTSSMQEPKKTDKNEDVKDKNATVESVKCESANDKNVEGANVKNEHAKVEAINDKTSNTHECTTNDVEQTTSTTTSVPPKYRIVRGPHWKESFRYWTRPFNHNHLRITRILRSLRVLGLQTECNAFFEALKLVFNDPSIRIREQTFIFWTRAVTRPLYMAPDNDQIQWLHVWEYEQENKSDDEEYLDTDKKQDE
jgi:hypothetical protein